MTTARSAVREGALAAAAAALLLRAASSCASEPYGDGTPDAALDVADAPPDVAVPPSDPCLLARPQAPPPVAPSSGEATLPPFALAFSGTSPVDSPTFDLDGVCTCDDREGVARRGTSSCIAPGNPPCDGDGGRDTAANDLLRGSFGFSDLTSLPRGQVRGGRANLLVRIAGYNGLPDDAAVAVGLVLSDGIRAPGCEGSTVDPGSGLWSAGECGDDVWSVRPDAVIGLELVPAITTTGYVSGGVLVAVFGGAVATPFSEAARLELREPRLVGRLVRIAQDSLARRLADASDEPGRDSRMWALEDATLAGRVSTASLLETLGKTRILAADGGLEPLCLASAFPTLVASVCGAADIASRSSQDFSGGACDALSTALPIRAVPARLGEVYERPRPALLCDPAAFRCP